MNKMSQKLLYSMSKEATDNATKEALTREIIQQFKNKKIPEGVYYGERQMFKSIPDAKHTYVAGIFNKKPKYIESQKLPNGQYATALSGYADMVFGLPIGGTYATINGKSGKKYFNNKDIDSIEYLVNKINEDNNTYNTELTPLTLDKRKRYNILKKMNKLIENNAGKRLGGYHVLGIPGIVDKKSCITTTGSLLANAKIDPKLLPETLGGIGGIDKDDIGDYITDLEPEVKQAGLFDIFKNKKDNTELNNKINLKTLFKKKKTPEEELKEEFERRIIESDPAVWNAVHEEDKYPKPGSRSRMISLIGTSIGTLYGLGKGYERKKTDPLYTTPAMLGAGVGFGALGFGLATTGDIIARGIGNFAGKRSAVRTKEKQKEYDKKRQPYSYLPGFDTYNAQMRKRVQKEEEKEQEN